jgi:hypothetical protein
MTLQSVTFDIASPLPTSQEIDQAIASLYETLDELRSPNYLRSSCLSTPVALKFVALNFVAS